MDTRFKLILFELTNRTIKGNWGFTQIELLVVAVIVGILASVSLPSFVGLLAAYRVQDGIAQIEGAIKEAQRNALDRSIVCRLNIDVTTKTITSVPLNCLASDRTFTSDIILAANLSIISFSYRGTTTNSGTIAISSINSPDDKRCLVISNGIGIMRVGIYNNDLTSSIRGNFCITSS
jgi:prepilin-type N-terminal cleavage/methylation domain-containing protein